MDAMTLLTSISRLLISIMMSSVQVMGSTAYARALLSAAADASACRASVVLVVLVLWLMLLTDSGSPLGRQALRSSSHAVADQFGCAWGSGQPTHTVRGLVVVVGVAVHWEATSPWVDSTGMINSRSRWICIWIGLRGLFDATSEWRSALHLMNNLSLLLL